MKYFLSLFFLFSGFSVLSAQEKHFIFIQSDNNQPFYVSLNSKLYSSTAIGFIIIPKLREGVYNFSVGFPKNAFPEQSFQATINKKDLGFNLKDFADKGWGLFNLQSLAVTMSTGTASAEVARAINENEKAKDNNEPISFNKKKKDITVAEAQIKKPVDTAVALAVAKPETQKQPEIAVKADSTASAPIAVSTSPENKKASEKGKKDGEVKKVSERKENDGVYLSYIESSNNSDTVKIIIPSAPTESVESNTVSSDRTIDGTSDISKSGGTPSSDKATAKSDNIKKAANGSSGKSKRNKEDLKFLDVNMNTPSVDSSKINNTPDAGNIPANKNNCKNLANDDDYLRIRRRMAHETTDERMINEAKKAYRSKCFSTSQIKALSTLFLSDEGRYRFFDASYGATSDAAEYYTLQSEFIDKYYINRFKAMLQ